MKHRLERVNEIIRRELSEIVTREIVFGAPLVTIQSVDVAPDLKSCRVFVSVLGNPKQQEDAIGKLRDKRRFLQGEIGKRIVLKYMPQLRFELDASVERGTRIMQIMDEIKVDEPPPQEEDPRENEP